MHTGGGRSTQTLNQQRPSDAVEFIELANPLYLRPGIQLFPFDKLDKALIWAKQSKLEQPNAVVQISEGIKKASSQCQSYIGMTLKTFGLRIAAGFTPEPPPNGRKRDACRCVG